MATDPNGQPRRRWSFNGEVTLGSAVNSVVIVLTAIGGFYAFLMTTRNTAENAAQKAAEVAEQLVAETKNTNETLKWIADRVWTIDNRLTGVEKTQDAQGENIRRLNNRFDVPVTPAPPRPQP